MLIMLIIFSPKNYKAVYSERGVTKAMEATKICPIWENPKVNSETDQVTLMLVGINITFLLYYTLLSISLGILLSCPVSAIKSRMVG